MGRCDLGRPRCQRISIFSTFVSPDSSLSLSSSISRLVDPKWSSRKRSRFSQHPLSTSVLRTHSFLSRPSHPLRRTSSSRRSSGNGRFGCPLPRRRPSRSWTLEGTEQEDGKRTSRVSQEGRIRGRSRAANCPSSIRRRSTEDGTLSSSRLPLAYDGPSPTSSDLDDQPPSDSSVNSLSRRPRGRPLPSDRPDSTSFLPLRLECCNLPHSVVESHPSPPLGARKQEPKRVLKARERALRQISSYRGSSSPRSVLFGRK
ncbi:hypothetical protein BDY24DRAFT_398192 [Mrakia frigida]|uniref:uncharacterized protein n=1 Tax=Mrakia frigida TaxID=29902 RepID=UPI003FCBF430